MNHPPAFQLYARDLLAERDAFDPEQFTAWMSLRCHAWLAPTRGEPPCSLPDDDAQLARLSGLGARWRKLGSAVRARFTARDGRLIDDTLLEQFNELLESRTRRSQAGRKGNEARWGSQRDSQSDSPGDSPSDRNATRNAIANGSQSGRTASASASASAVQAPATAAAAAADPVNELAIALTSAANQGITKRWGEQPNVLRWTQPAATALAEVVHEQGIPLELARDAIYSACVASKLERPPSSLAYFAPVLRDRWESQQARDAASAAPTPNVLPLRKGDPYAVFDQLIESERAQRAKVVS
jgi:hypothetical protein